ncbi:hypothetical protein [Tenacibaculum ascidiaceicola]|uniref:hypothetical protein n=1 Tax=Tenacibaculum ascidiaceicola TaxID=1699411 RepID=UPI003CE54828
MPEIQETKADFITSLKGDTGATGANGTDGVDGVDGKSAYQTWLDAGMLEKKQTLSLL